MRKKEDVVHTGIPSTPLRRSILRPGVRSDDQIRLVERNPRKPLEVGTSWTVRVQEREQARAARSSRHRRALARLRGLWPQALLHTSQLGHRRDFHRVLRAAPLLVPSPRPLLARFTRACAFGESAVTPGSMPCDSRRWNAAAAAVAAAAAPPAPPSCVKHSRGAKAEGRRAFAARCCGGSHTTSSRAGKQ